MTTNLNVRGIDAEAVRKIKLSAHARGMTIGRYIEKVQLLHAACLATPNQFAKQALEELGLQQVVG